MVKITENTPEIWRHKSKITQWVLLAPSKVSEGLRSRLAPSLCRSCWVTWLWPPPSSLCLCYHVASPEYLCLLTGTLTIELGASPTLV